LDEPPFAYKKITDILPVIGDTVEVEKIFNSQNKMIEFSHFRKTA